MTPQQRDELAGMMEVVRRCKFCQSNMTDTVSPQSYAENPFCQGCLQKRLEQHPRNPNEQSVVVGHYVCWVSSLDDCRPLLKEIERRGLWEEFVMNLLDIYALTHGIPLEIDNADVTMEIVWWVIAKCKPTDIVAAFQKTIEEQVQPKSAQELMDDAGKTNILKGRPFSLQIKGKEGE